MRQPLQQAAALVDLGGSWERAAKVTEVTEVTVDSAAQQSVLRTVLVSDLEGFTSMLCTLGDFAARDVMTIHDELLRNCLKEHRGVECAHTGDGLIASFDDARLAVSCAAAIQRRLRRLNQDAAKAAAIKVRIGVHAGRMLIYDNRVFGAAVITAVRLCATASSGEVVISAAVRDLVTASALTLRDLGALMLKGLPEPVSAFALDWRRFGLACPPPAPSC